MKFSLSMMNKIFIILKIEKKKKYYFILEDLNK